MEALLLIDVQNDYFKKGKFPLRGMKRAARNAANLLERFRGEGLPVIHIRHISAKTGASFFLPDTPGADIHPSVSPRENEKVFIKHYPSSFRETGLDEYLSEVGVTTLHIAGAMTNMCVDTTTRVAFDLGYSVIIHKDCCAARGLFGTRLIHRISIQTLGSLFAKIV